MIVYIILKIKWDKEFFKFDWFDFIVVFVFLYVLKWIKIMYGCYGYFFYIKNKYYGKDFYI